MMGWHKTWFSPLAALSLLAHQKMVSLNYTSYASLQIQSWVGYILNQSEISVYLEDRSEVNTMYLLFLLCVYVCVFGFFFFIIIILEHICNFDENYSWTFSWFQWLPRMMWFLDHGYSIIFVGFLSMESSKVLSWQL